MDNLVLYIEETLKEYLKETPFFVVEVNLLPNKIIEVFVDGEKGINLDQCARISQFLIDAIDNESVYERNFSMEVSSPGLNRPFHDILQYQKNLKRILKVTLHDNTIIQGQLNDISGNKIELLEKIKSKNKNEHKAKTRSRQIALKNIKESKVLISF